MTAGFFYRIKEFLQRICRVSFFGVAIILCGQTSTLLLVLHEHPWLLLWFSSPELAVQSSPRNCFAFSLIFFVLHHFVGVMMKLTKHFQACLSIVTSDSDCVWHPWNFCGDVFFLPMLSNVVGAWLIISNIHDANVWEEKSRHQFRW